MILEKLTYVCLIAVCIVSLTVLVKRGLRETNADSATAGREKLESSLVGKREAGLADAAWKGSERNVVMLLSSQCHFCGESMPLYRQLSTIRQQSGNRMSLLAVGQEGTGSLREYLNHNKVAVDNVLQARTFAGFAGTPAVFVVDSHGVIQRAFVGKLDRHSEAELLRLVRG